MLLKISSFNFLVSDNSNDTYLSFSLLFVTAFANFTISDMYKGLCRC